MTAGIGRFTIIKPADLDAALEWGRKLARATTLPVEVRPIQSDHRDRRVRNRSGVPRRIRPHFELPSGPGLGVTIRKDLYEKSA
jgi:L-alanine-DL-glutamate epimerase-like enolase superfamily enzyme